MDNYTKEELAGALRVIYSTISNCEKSQLKFDEGTSHHTLLKNRIKALNIAQSFITKEQDIVEYTKEDWIEALRPITSIISKCEKGQQKFAEGTAHHTRFKNIIDAMFISKAYITSAINNSD